MVHVLNDFFKYHHPEVFVANSQIVSSAIDIIENVKKKQNHSITAAGGQYKWRLQQHLGSPDAVVLQQLTTVLTAMNKPKQSSTTMYGKAYREEIDGGTNASDIFQSCDFLSGTMAKRKSRQTRYDY